MIKRSALLAVVTFFMFWASYGAAQPAPSAIGQQAASGLVQGVESYQVFPRVNMEGTIPFLAMRPGSLKAEVIRDADKLQVAVRNWTVTGQTQALVIDKIPVGGDYTIRFSSGADTQVFEHIMVGEIWVVGGGTNAYGSEGVPEPAISQIHMYRGRWQEAQDPLFGLGFFQLPPGKTVVTPWLRAALNYYQRTGIPVGLMGFCAPERDIDFFFDSKRVDLPVFRTLMEQHGRGASAFCWYQGEADRDMEQARVYKDRLKTMAAALRRYSGNPNMRMVVVQLSNAVIENAPPVTGFGDIREMQRQFCVEDTNAILIPALPYAHRDGMHLNADGMRQLGSRVAQALDEAKNNSGQPLWQGPKLASARVVGSQRRRVEVKFENAQRMILVSDPGEMGDPQEKWKMQWMVADAKHQGFPRAWKPEVKNGVLTVELSGGTFGPTQVDAQGHVMQVRLANFGFIMPMVVDLDGATINIDLAEPAMPGAKLYFGYLDNSKGYLTDDRGKPAAAFAEVPINE